jgi:hypothetical protein
MKKKALLIKKHRTTNFKISKVEDVADLTKHKTMDDIRCIITPLTAEEHYYNIRY